MAELVRLTRGCDTNEIVVSGAVFAHDQVAPRGGGQGVGVFDQSAVVGLDEQLYGAGLFGLARRTLVRAGHIAPDLTLSHITAIRTGEIHRVVAPPHPLTPREAGGTGLEAP